ncbi:MAG: pseudouridine-5'-phosphate glycosidase [Candidatus Syntrophosphaera sp.]|nr:pseudouridine-5'-phosphate glycosidase [Candidatus Syntrophosphaera sp.]
MEKLQNKVVLSANVASALEKGLPVVALESTVLTHGLPYPQNLSVSRVLEEILVNEGVTPATIIVLEGIAHIGLEANQVEDLAPRFKAPGSFRKLGMRDLALAFTQGHSGGTTVSATMKLAHLAGIEVFATGGIGGVHTSWREDLDISSDLTALAEIPVAVVSAGCKAFLDIRSTLEYLETLAVPVLGWQTDRFPKFYVPSSEHAIDRIDTAEEFALFWKTHLTMGGKGLLVANPIPAKNALSPDQIEAELRSGVISAKTQGITGKDFTPFVLDYLAKHTKGGSVEANLALLKNNVSLAASLAKALVSKEG